MHTLGLLVPEEYKGYVFITTILAAIIILYMRWRQLKGNCPRTFVKRMTHVSFILLSLIVFLLSDDYLIGLLVPLVLITVSLTLGSLRHRKGKPSPNSLLVNDLKPYSEGKNLWEKFVIFLWY
jgi:hypothetical protein